MASGGPRIVMGVDIFSGNPSSKEEALYSVVILKGGSIYAEYESVPLSRLVRLSWEHRPEAIGIDNIYELGSSEEDVARIAALLPPDTVLRQVTLWPEGFITLREAARRVGINLPQAKLSSIETARIAAELAYRGVGSRIKVVEEKTRIIVARGHRGGRPGGMSSQRYNRRVRAAILRMTREIRRRLDSNGFDYDLVFRKSEGGLERAVFIVYAPRSRLQGIVRNMNNIDIRVEVRPIYSSRLEFEYPRTSRKAGYLIVGIDPGVTLGLALLDLSGRPVLLSSYKEFDRTEIISVVERSGVPVLMATDVRSVPEAVKKLAAAFNVPIFSPPQDLSTMEKHEIAQSYAAKYGVKIPDTHVRDALAAAVKAYRSVEQKLAQAESYLSRIGLDLSKDMIKVAIIRGKTIAEALEEEIERLMSSTPREPRHVQPHLEEKARSEDYGREQRLEEEIRRLKLEKASMARRIKELRWRIDELEQALNTRSRELNIELIRDREIENLRVRNKGLAEKIGELEEKVKQLEERIGELRELLSMAARGEVIPVIIVDKLTTTGLQRLGRKPGKGEIVYVANPNIYEAEAVAGLADLGVAGVLVDQAEGGGLLDALRRSGIPVLTLHDYLVYMDDSILLVDPRVREVAKEEKRRLREMRRKLDLARLIEEYRVRRKKRLGSRVEEG